LGERIILILSLDEAINMAESLAAAPEGAQ
jgi:hypothetical protein